MRAQEVFSHQRQCQSIKLRRPHDLIEAIIEPARTNVLTMECKICLAKWVLNFTGKIGKEVGVVN